MAAQSGATEGGISDTLLMERMNTAEPKLPENLPLLADLTVPMTSVDGHVLAQLVVAGFVRIAATSQHLNKINVFPIPDADTGNNMVICLKKASRNGILHPEKSIRKAATLIAADTLLNGQGNSGTIFSHFFIQLAEKIQQLGKDDLTIDEFAEVLAEVGGTMNDAVSNPTEGTLMSVARECCKSLPSSKHATLAEMLSSWLAAAESELAKTPEQLVVDGKYVLKEAKVVDSGAQGFVYMVEGMVQASRGEVDLTDAQLYAVKEAKSLDDSTVHIEGHNVESEKYQFCTEAVIKLKEGVTKDAILAAVAPLEKSHQCDSVACVVGPGSDDSGRLGKVHLHTNEPSTAFDVMMQFSSEPIAAKEKVEDMFKQTKEAHSEKVSEKTNAKLKVCVTFLQMGIVNGPEILDAVEIPFFLTPSEIGEPINSTDSSVNVNEFINYLRQNPQRVFTAAPPVAAVRVTMLEALERGEDVFAISFHPMLSACHRNILAARDTLPPEKAARLHVFAPLGLCSVNCVVRDALRMSRGLTAVELCERAAYVDARSVDLMFASAESYNKMVASGRIPKPLVAKDVQDGETMVMGRFSPNPDEKQEPMKRVMGLVSTVHREPAADDSESKAHDFTLSKIKATLKPNEVLKDVTVFCTGRVDLAHKIAKKIAAVLPVDGGLEAIIVYGEVLLDSMMSSWGNSKIAYWVDTLPAEH